MKKNKWTTNDYVFAAMISVALLVTASIIIPFTLPLNIPGLANAVNGLFGSFFIVIGLIRLKKPGSLLLITGIYSIICLSVSPVVFGFILIGGIVSELFCSLVFRGYHGKLAPVCGAVLLKMAMFPASMALSFFFLPERYKSVAPAIFILAELAIFTTATIGSLAGLKVAKELARAGKLQIE